MASAKDQDIKEVAANFDFHGEALDTIFDTYAKLRSECPVGRSEKYGGFWFVTKSDDIFAARLFLLIGFDLEGLQYPVSTLDNLVFQQF